MRISLYKGTIFFIFCAMCIVLISTCPLPEPTPEPKPAAEPTAELTAPSAMSAPELAARNNSLAVTWSPPTNNGGSDIIGYNLRHRAEGSPAENAEENAERTELSYGIIGAGYTIGELTNGIVYEVQMRAVNAQRTGPWSESAALAPAHVPGAPAPPALEANNTALTVTWKAPPDIGGSDITAYDLRYRESRDAGNAEWTEIEWAKIIEGITPAPGITDTHYTIGSGLTNGLMYEVQARAINGEGTGPWSESAVLAPATVPGAPDVTLEANDRELVATWTVTDDGGNAISAYNLRYRETVGEGEEPVEWTELSIIGTSYTFTGLTNGAEYEAGIQAINAQGTGSWSAAVAGTPWYFPLQEEITASDAAERDQFGASVAIDGNTAIVGAPFTDDAGSKSGSAYVFTRGSDELWRQHDKMLAPDAASGDQFGISVAIYENTAIVGALFDDTTATDGDNMEITLADSGSAYIFTKGSTGNWSQQAKLTATDAATGDYFGTSVAIYENTVIVGAYGYDDTMGTITNAGAAYIFIRDSNGNWSQQAKLVADDVAAGDNFGYSVAIYGNTVIVGAPYANNEGNSNSGSAYTFTRNSNGQWNQPTKLAITAVSGDNFGTSVAIYGNTIMVGIPGADSDRGAIRIYRRNGTTWEDIHGSISAHDQSNNFGNSVAIHGNTAIVGAYRNDAAGVDSVSAYVYTRGSDGVWRQHDKMLAPDAAAGDNFGYSVAFDGETAIVGASFTDDAGSKSGSAYLFSQREQ